MATATGLSSTSWQALDRKVCTALCRDTGEGRWRKDHLDTHHIVSFVKNHNCPLQVKALGSATLQHEGGQGLGEARGRQGSPRRPARTSPPTEPDARGPFRRHAAQGIGRVTHTMQPHSHRMEEARAGLGLLLTWGGPGWGQGQYLFTSEASAIRFS